MNDITYLITGIVGALGKAVAAGLIARGKRVVGLVAEGDLARLKLPGKVQLVEGDLTDLDSLDRFFAQARGTDLVVLHCAHVETGTSNFNQGLCAQNFGNVRNITDACLKYRAKKLVYVGHAGAIAEKPHGILISEPDFYDPKLVVGCYNKSVALAAQYVQNAAVQQGLDASIVLPSGICEPTDFSPGTLARLIINYCQNTIQFGVAGSFNTVDVQDLAAAVIAASEQGRPGASYILSNNCVSLAWMFERISASTGALEIKNLLSPTAARVLGKAFDLVELFTQKPQALNSLAIYNLLRNNAFDCSRAKTELGFQARSLEQTLAETITWLFKQNQIQIVEYEEVDFMVNNPVLNIEVMQRKKLKKIETTIEHDLTSGHKQPRTKRNYGKLAAGFI